MASSSLVTPQYLTMTSDVSPSYIPTWAKAVIAISTVSFIWVTIQGTSPSQSFTRPSLVLRNPLSHSQVIHGMVPRQLQTGVPQPWLPTEPSTPQTARVQTVLNGAVVNQVALPFRPSSTLMGAILLGISFLAGLVYRLTSQETSSSETIPVTKPTGSWSNPGNDVLRPLAPNLWVAERAFVWNGIDVGGKMAVVRLADGSIWVHSPVALDEELKTAIDALGPVRHIMSPNFEHVKYAQQWITAYPEATPYGCPGAIAKFPNIPYRVEVGADNNVPEAWQADLEVTFIDAERNPFTGKPFFNEVVFLHKPTKTFIVTDLFWNYPEDVPFSTRLWKFGMDQVYLPFYDTFMVSDRSRFNQIMRRILSWDFDALLPCHGTYLSSGGKQTFIKHLQLESLTQSTGPVGEPGRAATVGAAVAKTIEAMEMKRVEMQSVQDADGWTGEPKEWAASDSAVQKISEISQVGIFGRAKLWLAENLAGEYDPEAIVKEMSQFESQGPVVMYSFTKCPFCLKAKEILNSVGVKYQVMELDVVPNGKAIRAELGKRTGRTSMPSVWANGQFIGGCNDGGLGGVARLHEQGQLVPLLEEAGALRS